MIARMGLLRMRAAAWPRPTSSATAAYERISTTISSSSARGFASLVSSEWVRESGEKLLLVDCEQPAAFQRAHIPSAQPFALAASGLKVHTVCVIILSIDVCVASAMHMLIRKRCCVYYYILRSL